ncbi:MAG TPA: hypothetical protein VJN89_18445 [Candidatus Acidoferrum sp.]|nr:hypothetical protein [Candidatus Acidoferrum sp.]
MRLIFDFLSDASLLPPSRITLRAIRPGSVSTRPSRSLIAARNQALHSGAPLSLAAACIPIPSLRIPLPAFIRIARLALYLSRSLTSWQLYRY